jgi:hypothetical protein
MEVVIYMEGIAQGRLAVAPMAFVSGNPLVLQSAVAWLSCFFVLIAIRCLNTPLHDIFISYKSEDAALARRLTDGLAASGWKVWFAEQQVLLAWRWLFPLAILAGIRDARFGLAITNDRWARSRHCAFEIRMLLWMLGPRHVLEVCAPREPLPHQSYPRLAQSPSFAAGATPAILDFVKDTTGATYAAKSSPEAPTEGASYRTEAGGRPLSLTVEGWRMHRSGAAGPAALGGQAWSYDALPEGQLFVNVHWGRETSHEGQRVDQGIDDRRMFDTLVKWAPKHIGRVRAKVRGVHLLFHSGLSQMGVTYWVREQTVAGPSGATSVGGYWTRKLSLVIPNRATGAMGEFVFTFGFRGPFADYCRYAHIMDAFASSLVWD